MISVPPALSFLLVIVAGSIHRNQLIVIALLDAGFLTPSRHFRRTTSVSLCDSFIAASGADVCERTSAMPG